ncbi:unnamed protein product [Adineta steineri]|uniref:NAD(+)--protein-arginine ADP-ribosyltransferase n=1 Tax=Adineta steineri TaxID=433720 RepID=A0A818GBE5_9BILA|nr:unnamed protein product [Adineta steineri]
MDAWKRLVDILSGTKTYDIAMASIEVDSKNARKTFDCPNAYKYAKILQQKDKKNWCEWHYNTAGNANAAKIAKNFRRKFEETNASSSISDKIAIIDEVIREIKPLIKDWDENMKNFKVNSDEQILESIFTAYTSSQELTSFINKDLAANTYHALELYCTSLNCPILARTEAYTEAFTSILFHPLSKKYHFTEECKLYRGCIIADEELVGNYKKGNTIITTTFLSASTDPAVVVPYITDAPTDAIAIRCEYEINNNHCCTALDLRGVCKKKEEEILILRYTPFEITSAIQSESGGHMEVHFREYEEQ